MTFIRSAKNEDFEAIAEISDLQLGGSYLTIEDLTNFSANKNTTISISTTGDIVTGFLISFHDKAKVIIERIGISYQNELSFIQPFKEIALLKTIAVHPKYDKQGLGKALVSHWMSKNAKCDLLLSLNWQSGKPMPLNHLLVKMGFQEKVNFENYWKSLSLSAKSTCPQCGEPPCLCSAVIFLKENVSASY